MRNNSVCMRLAVLIVCPVLLSGTMQAGEEILNAGSYLRAQLSFRTPVVISADGQIKPMTYGKDSKPMPLYESAQPPRNWAAPEFNDLFWTRTCAPVSSGGKDWVSSLQYSRLCVRGKFLVDDPAKVKGLAVVVEYIGGAVVYLNGVEIKRQHLPAGELKSDTVAEKYPDDAYAENGALLGESVKRVRKMEADLSAAGLRKGVNVLAVEILRAPANGAAFAAKGPVDIWRTPVDTHYWSHVRLTRLCLTAETGSGVVPNTGRPGGVQVWTVQPLETVMAWNYGDPLEQPAIELQGTANGAFSGRIIVSSGTALKGVKVTAGALAGDNGSALPAQAIQIRYALPADTNTGWIANVPGSGRYRYDVLEETPPAETPVAAAEQPAGKGGSQAAAVRDRGLGALLPVWVTVNVPADAKPGIYRGSVTAGADGLAPVSVPLSIKVHGWKLPDPDVYAGVNDFVQSPESVALAYKEPFWTDRHFEMMGRSLELGERLGSRFCYANILLGGHCMGNSEGMIRWIPKGDGSFDYDFSLFDRYLDLFAGKVGKPRALVVTVWTTSHHGFNGKVSRLDPATKKVESMEFPAYKTPEAVGFWKPVMDQIRKRVEARGWWDVTVIGHTGDFTPTAKEVDCFKTIWPDGRWIFSAHMATTELQGSDKSKMPVVVGERVWTVGRLYNPDIPDPVYGLTYPQRWKKTPGAIELAFPRTGQGCMKLLGDDGRLALWRLSSEAAIQGNLHGYGRVGLDFWPLPGRRHTRWDSLAGSSNQGMAHSTLAIIGVGRTGPAATERYEMCREGVQIREAILFVQRALVAGKADAALLARAKALLDERARNYLRTLPEQNSAQAWLAFEGGGWQERDGRLFEICTELARSGEGR